MSNRNHNSNRNYDAQRNNHGGSVKRNVIEVKVTPNALPVTTASSKSYKTRLFVGNLPLDITPSQFESLFTKYKLEDQHLIKGKGYGFIQLATREEAEKVRREMDGEMKYSKVIRVNYCNPTTALKVRNLGPLVSNELLHSAFSMFGEVCRAVVIADDKGRSIGEGIVEFESKRAYFAALRACTENCFLINNTLQPVIAEEYQVRDEDKGVPEASLQKHHMALQKDREKTPRIVVPGTFEYEYANRWKKLYDIEKAKKAEIDREIEDGKRTLMEDIEAAYYEHQANMLRQQLRQLEEKSALFQKTKTIRDTQWQDEQVRIQEEQRRLQDDRNFRTEQRMQEEMYRRQQQEDEMRRREMLLKEEEAYRMQMAGHMMPPDMLHPDMYPQTYEEPAARIDVMTGSDRMMSKDQLMPPEIMPRPPPAPRMEEIMRRSPRGRSPPRSSPPRRRDHHRDSSDRHRPHQRSARSPLASRRDRSPRGRSRSPDRRDRHRRSRSDHRRRF